MLRLRSRTVAILGIVVPAPATQIEQEHNRDRRQAQGDQLVEP